MSNNTMFSDYRTYIIAEIGSNWATLGDCLLSITKAKTAGADAVKFQWYSHQDMYGTPGEMKGELPDEFIPKLAEKARAVGIDFMCTPFSVEKAEKLNKYVNMHKVASSDMTHWPLLQYLSSTNKPILLSTGGIHTENEVRESVRICGPKTTIMHCVSSYPTNKAALGRIGLLKEQYPDNIIGYSDHTTDVYDIPYMAVQLGARVLEKHVNFVDLHGTPDAPHSLSFKDFKNMISLIRGETPNDYWAHSEQLDMRLKHNRRLIAIKNIKKGEKLVLDDNVGFFRSKVVDTIGSNPFSVNPVHTALAKQDHEPGEGVDWDPLSI